MDRRSPQWLKKYGPPPLQVDPGRGSPDSISRGFAALRSGAAILLAFSLWKVDRPQLSLNIFKAPLDTIDVRGQLELLQGRNLAFLIVAKGSHQELPVAQEPFSFFLRHAPKSVTGIVETVQRQADARPLQLRG